MCRLRLFLLAGLCFGAGCRREEPPAFLWFAPACGLLFKSVDSSTQQVLAPRFRGTPLGPEARRKHWFSAFAVEPDPDWVLKLSKLK
jgi:hypothetical protein